MVGVFGFITISSGCGFGRQGCNREIAFYKATAIAQGCNIVRRELGLPTTDVPAADPRLQADIVQGSAKRCTAPPEGLDFPGGSSSLRETA